jgi:hypothetical protein
MQQKDFLLREIEKISTLILSIIGKFVPSKTIEEQQHTEELISNQLKEHYGNDLKSILSVDEKGFETEFSHNKGFNYENIELLADLLYTLGNDDFEIKTTYIKKALELYEFIDRISKTFSFERQEKIRAIENII